MSPLETKLDGRKLALLFCSLGKIEVEFGIENLPVFFFRGDVVTVDVRADGDPCHAVFLLIIFGSVPFRQVGVHLIFGKGGINMFLAVIVELADSHFRDLVLSCISPYPLGIDLIFLCNLFGGVILGDVKVLFGHDAFVRLGLHHQLDVRTADERLFPTQTGCPQFGFLDQFIDNIAG